jgi:hypothetical protein
LTWDNVNKRLGLNNPSPKSILSVIGVGENGAQLVLSSSLIDQSLKDSRLACLHFKNDEEPLSMIAGRIDSLTSRLLIGGGRAELNTATSIELYTAVDNTTTNGSLRWSILSNGILQSNGAQTIQTSTGNLTLATAGGNGDILLSPHGAGNVGIGTTSPFSLLSIERSVAQTYLASSSSLTVPILLGNTMYIWNNAFQTGGASFLNLASRNNDGALNHSYIGSVSESGFGSFMVFGRRTGITSYAETMRITSGGAMGLGITNPTNTAGRFEASNDIVAFSSSDRRWKTNIISIQSSLSKISNLNGVYFDWIEDEPIHGNKGKDYGIIAQEVEALFPEMVQTRDNGMKAVKYDRLIPVMIEAIKELSNKVKILENGNRNK